MTDAGLAGVAAIVGMSGRFPGAADVDELWRNVRAGRHTSVPVSEEELRRRGVPAAQLASRDYVRVESVLDNFDRFDAPFFGVTDTVAAALDPQHRLLLECAWSALEDAGFPPTEVPGRVGVFVSRSTSDYDHLVRADEQLMAALGPLQIRLYTEKDTLSAFLSYKLNLTGPSFTVQTACSSSLVALHLAAQSLASLECDVALVGAAALPVPYGLGYLYRPGGIHSPDGRCRPFDASAGGTLPGCGVAVVILRRADEVMADGDHIRALIRATAVNNDGAEKVSFGAPGMHAQTSVIAEAMAVAGVPASSIFHVEAHGTGTPIGDPIEVAALTGAYRAQTDRAGFCALGSVKANIGHLGSAAGVTSLIKTVLALEHGEIPPVAGFIAPNPEIELDGSPFYIPARPTAWPAEDHPRRAAVSSFGMGGTNAHAVLEQAPPQPLRHAPARRQLVLGVSARTQVDLATSVQRLADYLDAAPNDDMSDVAFTLARGRVHFRWRSAVVATDAASAAALLRITETRWAADAPPNVVVFVADGIAPDVGPASEQVRGALEQHGLDASEPAARTVAAIVTAWHFANLLKGLRAAPTFYGARGGRLAAACAANRLPLEEAVRLAASGADGWLDADTPAPVTEDAVVCAIGQTPAVGRDAIDLLAIGVSELAAELYRCGLPIDLESVNGTGHRVSLPSYPFNGLRHWPAAPSAASDETETDVHSLVQTRHRLAELTAAALGEASTVDTDTSFLELGLDSIALLHLTQMIDDEFGVSVPFRALFDEMPTVATLAAWMDTLVPPIKTTIESKYTPSPISPPDNPATVPADVQDVVNRQLDLMAAQLRLLSVSSQIGPPFELGSAERPATSPNSSPAAEPRTPENPGLQASPPASASSSADAVFVPISGDGLQDGDPILEYSRALAPRLSARIATSADLSRSARSQLANERAAANFRTYTKGMNYPIAVARSAGGRIWDVDGNEYVDLAMGFGALLFGHSPSVVVDSLRTQLDRGLGLGLESPDIADAAATLCRLTGVDRVAFCNSGTEAVMTALRLARTVTGRRKIAMFTGGYHGMLDSVLVRQSRRGAIPLAPGIGSTDDTLVLDFGDQSALDIVERHGAELAAVLVEPRQSRRPAYDIAEFLAELRRVTQRAGVALIFDEVITGFRTHAGGMQAILGIRADLVTYGKAMGSGIPVAAVAGHAAFLDAIDGGHWHEADGSYPAARQTFFAGTYFKSPLLVPVLSRVLKQIAAESPALQQTLDLRTAALVERLRTTLVRFTDDVTVASFSSLFRFEFPARLRAAADLFHLGLLEKGVHIPETRSCFLSTAHTDQDLDQIVTAVEKTLSDMDRHGVFAAGDAAAAVPYHDGHPTSMQQQCMLEYLGGPDDSQVFYNEHEALVIDGPLDAGRLAGAIDAVVGANDSLRCTFRAGSNGQYLQIQNAAAAQLVMSDLSAEANPDRAAQELLATAASQAFDLRAGPMFRPHLVRIAEHRHYLLLAAHHLVTDGWSHAQLLQQLSIAYRDRLTSLPDAPSYLAFAANQRADLADGRLDRELAFWRDYLAGADPAVSIADRDDRDEAAAARGFEAGFTAVDLNSSETAMIANFGRKVGASAFTVVLAAIADVIGGRSGGTDVVVASPMTNRTSGATHRIVGFFANSPLIRVNVAGAATFAALVERARDAVLPVYDHQMLPAELVLRELGLNQHLIRVGYEDASVKGDAALVLGDARITTAHLPFQRRLRRELNIDVLFRGDSMRISADYAVERFRPTTVDEVLAEIRAALRARARVE